MGISLTKEEFLDRLDAHVELLKIAIVHDFTKDGGIRLSGTGIMDHDGKVHITVDEASLGTLGAA